MSISGVSAGGNAYLAYNSMKLHAPGCTCSLCSPQPVETSSSNTVSTTGRADSGKKKNETELTDEELSQIRQLQARDRAVRQHELAHMSAAGGLATSGPSYTYQRGPDGVNYAIGGEVSIDVSPGRTPAETLDKAKTIERAALAPKDPSGADQAVAAQARNMALTAQQEIAKGERAENAEDIAETNETNGAVEPTGQGDDDQNDMQTKRSDRVEQTYQTASDARNPTTLISAYA
ncbi:putative metalloprotease CJM1_0395 family protein [Chitinimonas sp. PSY-7]|uniref:putative metalloprotease CJM1_0395 family protein n=1 Tax=Chitinimonas sp. PSY-7 TaxID=3459088 RepID=UPI0040401AD7